MSEHVDVLVVGAGLSGIGAACRLRTELPGRTLAILESRGASGGTWDLFGYPGIRSDSDMFTFGFSWRPWPGQQALADGPNILAYLRETAREYGVDRLIRYDSRVTAASWDSSAARWTVEICDPTRPERPPTTMTAGFLYCCSGYYDYDDPYQPDFPGQDSFAGRIVHPQLWPDDLDYAGQDVVVIGSGATAVTLVPAMAPTAGRVTMLQRSPSYVMSRIGRDPVARALSWLPTRLGFPVVRWANIALTVGTYQLAQHAPRLSRWLLRWRARHHLPAGVDVDVHFKPRYDPWDQRLCFVPDADLFTALDGDRAEIVTDEIATLTPRGIRLTSGRELTADLIVTATGLRLLPFGGIEMSIDGRPVDVATTMTYRGLMLSGVPNFAYVFGYVNASWTLKADLVAAYVVRLLRHLDRTGRRYAVPKRPDDAGERPFLDFASGYVQRALADLPHQGDRDPWRQGQNYLVDRRALLRHDLDDGEIAFVRSSEGETALIRR